MIQQARDFLDECMALEALLKPLGNADFETPTAFKSWTFNSILRHLHVWNYAADLSLRDAATFKHWIEKALDAISNVGFTQFEFSELHGLAGIELLGTWTEVYTQTAEHFATTSPSTRVNWAGPTMSARSSISARQMETWAHSQAIFDELGVRRANTDRIRNIVVMGHNTYDWTFKNRGLKPPSSRPRLELTAPSGAIWTFGEDVGLDKITGLAEEFCQVVTQTRNIADTDLKVSGNNATRWMSMAQCFAGPPVDPPVPGSRMTSIDRD